MKTLRRAALPLVLTLAWTLVAIAAPPPAAQWLAPALSAGPAAAGPAIEAGPAGALPEVPAPMVTDRPPAPATGRLRLPAAGIDARIEPVLVDAQGNMAVPSRPDLVGWYARGPAPGSPGDAMLDGHLDTAAGSAVFGNLSRAAPGNHLTVEWGDGRSYEFVIESVHLYGYDAHPAGLFATDGPPRLSLVTCAGPWDSRLGTYRQRLVVDARLA